MVGYGATAVFHPVMRQHSIDEKINKDLARKQLRQAAAQIFIKILPASMYASNGSSIGSLSVPSGTESKTTRLEFYEAPEPLTIDFGNKPATKENATLALAGLKYWHGYNGGYFANSDNICDALIDGHYRVHINSINYHGQWFFANMLLNNDMTFPTRGTYRLCRAERFGPECL